VRLKKSNSLSELLNTIQLTTGHNLDEVAEKIGRSRPYLNALKNSGKDTDVVLKTVELVRIKYAKELGNRILDKDKIKTLESWIVVFENEIASLRSERTGEPAGCADIQNFVLKVKPLFGACLFLLFYLIIPFPSISHSHLSLKWCFTFIRKS